MIHAHAAAVSLPFAANHSSAGATAGALWKRFYVGHSRLQLPAEPDLHLSDCLLRTGRFVNRCNNVQLIAFHDRGIIFLLVGLCPCMSCTAWRYSTRHARAQQHMHAKAHFHKHATAQCHKHARSQACMKYPPHACKSALSRYWELTLVCRSGCKGTRRSMRLRKAGAGSMSRAPDQTLLSSRVASIVYNRPMAAQGIYINPQRKWMIS